MRQTGEEHEKYTRRHGLAPEVALITASQSLKKYKDTCQVNHLRLTSTIFPDGWPSCCIDFFLSHFQRDEFCLPSFTAPRSPALSTTNLSCSQKHLEDLSLHVSHVPKSPYHIPIPHSTPRDTGFSISPGADRLLAVRIHSHLLQVCLPVTRSSRAETYFQDSLAARILDAN